MEHVSSARPIGKFPEKVDNLKRRARLPGWNFRTESRVPFTFLVVCTSSRSTVGHRDLPGFKTKWNNFLPIGNSTFAPTEISGFFPKWKAPTDSAQEPTTLGSCSAGGQHPGDELAVLYTIVQRNLRYTKMAAAAAVSFVVF